MFVDVPDALLSTVAFGPGDPRLLALNGWSAAWQAWQPTFEVLTRTIRCVSYDTRGTGGSTGSPADISVDRLVEDAVAVMDAHGLDRAVVAGESLGGFLALRLAEAHPDRVAGLVLVATPWEIEPSRTGPLILGARSDYASTVAAFTAHCLAEDRVTDHLHHWGRSLFDQAQPECAAALLEAAHGVSANLDAVDVPTVVLHGDCDAVVPIDDGRRLASTIRNARFVQLDGAGHAPTVTRPQEVAAVALDVLRASMVAYGAGSLRE